MKQVACPYCGAEAEKVTGYVIYGTRYPKLLNEFFYICRPCKARVGCHQGTDCALGTPANAHTRKMRNYAHNHLDALWWRKICKEGCSKHEARCAAYEWLAGKMGIPVRDCHIGMFDDKQCLQVIHLCKPFSQRIFNREKRERRDRVAA